MPFPLFILISAMSVVFLSLGSVLLLRPAAILQFQGRRYVGRAVPDNAATRTVVRVTKRMPSWLSDRPGEDPRTYRDDMIENPSKYPRVMTSYRLMGGMMILVAGLWWVEMIL